MPTRRPTGARSETIRCEYCGEDYSITYKRCPFCDDQPAPRPIRREPDEVEYEELPHRRSRRDEVDGYDEPPRRSRRDEVDGYDESPRRGRRDEVDDYEEPPRRRSTRDEEEDEPRRSRRDVEDDYEEPPRRRSRRNEEEDDDYDESPRDRRDSQGGKRLVTNARGGGYRHHGPSPLHIIGAILSVLLFAAAVYVVYSIAKPFLGKDPPAPSVSPITSTVPSTSPSAAPSISPAPSGDPGTVVPPPTAGVSTPPPVDTAIPSGQMATGFSLGKTEFTLSETYPTYQFNVKFSPEGSTGSITWSSSKPSIVSVDQSGKTAAVASGIATITATMAGGYTQSCMVRSTFGGTPAAPSASAPAIPSSAPSAAPTPSAPVGGKLSLNVPLGLDGTVYDFSLKVGETWNLKVKNAAGTAAWIVKDASVATVSATGLVTGVSGGRTTITATVDGQTLECIVRVN